MSSSGRGGLIPQGSTSYRPGGPSSARPEAVPHRASQRRPEKRKRMTPQSTRIRRRGGVHHSSTQNRRAGGAGAHYFSTQSLRGADGCCILPGESAEREPHRSPEKDADPRRVTMLRRELADAERALRTEARRKADRLASAEDAAFREARDACHAYDRIRPNANARLDALRAGSPERFRNERQLAEMALREATARMRPTRSSRLPSARTGSAICAGAPSAKR